LELSLFAQRPAEWTEPVLLSAAHVPEAKQFIFSEDASMAARITGPGRCELTVTGPFKARLAPSRETDVIVHLEKPAAARLLSFLMAQARQ
jgi:hypothetical protein